MLFPSPSLMLITCKGAKNTLKYLHFISECIDAGVNIIQLREKNLSKTELYDFALQLNGLCKNQQVLFIVNDDYNLALDVNADGVHLGQGDGNVIKARKLLGKKKLIGVSVNTLEQLESSNYLPIDYVGAGSIFKTNSKKDAEIIGTKLLEKMFAISSHPIVAIGGITEANLVNITDIGVNNIAVIEAIHDSYNAELTIKNLIHQIKKVN